MPDAIRIALQGFAYAAFAAFIGYFSVAPAYQPLDPGQALIRLSFSQPGKLLGQRYLLTEVWGAGYLDQPSHDQRQAVRPFGLAPHAVRDHQARALPDVPRRDVRHGVRWNVADRAAQRVPQHVGVRAPAGVGRHRARAADHLSAADHQRVTSRWIVVLVHLDVVIVRDLPAELVHEPRLAELQVLVKGGSVPVLTEEVESDVAHESLPLVESEA